VIELYRRRHLYLSYYEHANYEFTLQDPTSVLGRRMIIFNQQDLVIERRQYRAARILKLSQTIDAINKEFTIRGMFQPKVMFTALFRLFPSDDLQKLSRFVMVSFHDEKGLYMVVDHDAVKEGSVIDKLCVGTTTTTSSFLNTSEFGFVFRNFIKTRVFFETDFWKKYRMLNDFGIHSVNAIETIMLLSAYLRYYLLYMVF
jgi:hypothetical protein